METFNNIMSSMQDKLTHSIVREMFLSIKNERPNFATVYYHFLPRLYYSLARLTLTVKQLFHFQILLARKR